MARTNYGYEKRQKEIAKKKKKEEKRQRKLGKDDTQPKENPDQSRDGGENTQGAFDSTALCIILFLSFIAMNRFLPTKEEL